MYQDLKISKCDSVKSRLNHQPKLNKWYTEFCSFLGGVSEYIFFQIVQGIIALCYGETFRFHLVLESKNS